MILDKGRDGANKDKPKVMSRLLHCAKTTYNVVGLNKDSQAVGYWELGFAGQNVGTGTPPVTPPGGSMQFNVS